MHPYLLKYSIRFMSILRTFHKFDLIEGHPILSKMPGFKSPFFRSYSKFPDKPVLVSPEG